MRSFFTVMLLVFAISLATSAFGEEIYCDGIQLREHSFGSSSNTYVLSYKCDQYYQRKTVWGHDTMHAEYKLEFHGDYNVVTKKAKERIVWQMTDYTKDGDISEIENQSFNIETTCPHDPWIIGGGCEPGTFSVNCGPGAYCGEGGPAYWIGKNKMTFKQPNPQSSNNIPASVRQALLDEYEAFSKPPQIVFPKNGDKYDFPEEITIKIRHDSSDEITFEPYQSPADTLGTGSSGSNQDPEFKVEWRPDAQHALKNVTAFLTDIKTQDGITIATLRPHEMGAWTIRVRRNANSWWSDPTTFKVIKSLNTEPEVINIPTQPGTLPLPEIILPRANRTYNAREAIPLRIEFQPGYKLRYEVGFRAKGESSFEKFLENYSSTGKGYIDKSYLFGGYLLAAKSESVELVIRTWLEPLSSTAFPQELLVDQPEVRERVVGVLVPQLVITSPEENQTFFTPASVTFAIPLGDNILIGHDIELSQEIFKIFDIEFWRAGNAPGALNAFFPYTKAEVTGRFFGDLLLCFYTLEEPGSYKFRIRLNGMFVEGGSQWTDWRKIKVKSLKSELKIKGDLTQSIQKNQIELSQKVENQLSKKTGQVILTTKTSMGAVSKIDGSETKNVSMIKKSLNYKPTITRPTQNQKFKAEGSLPLVFRNVEKDESVKWELEYKSFEKNNYKKLPTKNIRINKGTSGTHVTGKIITKKAGDYRVRVRSKKKGSTWGQWRFFQVGKLSKSKAASLTQKVEPAKQINSQEATEQEKTTKKLAKPKVNKVQPVAIESEPKTKIQLQN